MEFTDVVRRRRMVRSFADRPIPAEALRRLLDNGRRGPSAGFSQGYAFLVLTGADRGRFWDALTRDGRDDWASDGVRKAGAIVVPLAAKNVYLDRYAEPDKGWTDRDERRWPVPFWLIDTGMAAMLMLLTAVDEGLGALFFGIPPEADADVRAEFGIPADHVPIGAIALGYREGPEPPGSSSTRRRRPLDDIVHHGTW